MKQLIRKYIWWSNINHDIENVTVLFLIVLLRYLFRRVLFLVAKKTWQHKHHNLEICS